MNKTRLLVPALGLFALVGGFVSFIGWTADLPRLTDWYHNGISIQPNATLAVAGAGVGLVLLSLGFRRIAAVIGVLVGLLGLTAFLQYVFGFTLDGLNTVLMFDRPWGRVGVTAPGRMGPPGAFCWTLIGPALVLASGVAGRRARRFVPGIALITLALAMFAITGYLYNAKEFYSAPHLTVIALQTAIFVLAVSMGLIAAVPEHAPMRLLVERGPAGVIARAATPAIILVSFTLGLFRLAGERAGLYDLPTGTAARTLIESVLMLGLLWWTVVTIRRHDAALREVDRRKDEFLATLGHELRGPLAPIRNMLEILQRTGSRGAVQIQARDTMDRQMRHLARLVDDLVDVGRVSHDKLELRRERVPLAPIIEHALETCRPLADQKHLELQVSLPDEAIVVNADPVRLAQVFGNILTNACNYTDAGSVAVIAELRGAEAVVRIRDTGIGIPPAKLEYVFDMFTQLGAKGERSPGGLGIGLTLVKRLVQMHGGTVTAHSEGIGKGTEVIVRIPGRLYDEQKAEDLANAARG